jgi:hypothetical protein
MKYALFGLIFGALLIASRANATEQPSYTASQQSGPIEVRQYGSMVAAEVSVAGDRETASSAGFRALAGYIFGGNSGKKSIAMTAPVVQAQAQGQNQGQNQAKGQSIAMTAPVVMRPATTDTTTTATTSTTMQDMSFILPSSLTLETAPTHWAELKAVALMRPHPRVLAGPITPLWLSHTAATLELNLDTERGEDLNTIPIVIAIARAPLPMPWFANPPKEYRNLSSPTPSAAVQERGSLSWYATPPGVETAYFDKPPPRGILSGILSRRVVQPPVPQPVATPVEDLGALDIWTLRDHMAANQTMPENPTVWPTDHGHELAIAYVNDGRVRHA